MKAGSQEKLQANYLRLMFLKAQLEAILVIQQNNTVDREDPSLNSDLKGTRKFFFQVFGASAMVNDLLMPHRKSASYKKQFDLSWPTLLRRHRFLLTALVLLTCLCTVYLYFAITLGEQMTCSGLHGTKKALCSLEVAKATVSNAKLKFF
ncbi:hypothetical protein ACFE04_013039 [Oxalis oulophora]